MQTNLLDPVVTKESLQPSITEQYEKRHKEIMRDMKLRLKREDIEYERQWVKFWGRYRDVISDETTKKMVDDILSHHLTKLSGLLR